MIKVLFVCLGNICRSPTAEGIFRKEVEDQGLAEHISVDSAGTSDWHIGGPPDRRSQQAANSRGIDLSLLKARQVSAQDFNDFDYVIAMDSSNFEKLRALCPKGTEGRLRMCLAYAPDWGLIDVPDPYYEGNFDGVFDMVGDACKGLLAEIRNTHNL